MRPRIPIPEQQPNPALKGTRGYALACFPLVLSARAPWLGRWARRRKSKSASGGQVRWKL